MLARVHSWSQVAYSPQVKITDAIVQNHRLTIVHITDSIVHIADSIVHIAESLALNGYHVIKNGRESHGEANNERYELRVGHGALLLSTMLPQLYAAFAVMSSAENRLNCDENAVAMIGHVTSRQ